MNIDDRILNLESFKNLDRETFEAVENQFIESIGKIHNSNEYEKKIELYKQKIICLESLNYYRKILVDLGLREREIMRLSKEIHQEASLFMMQRIDDFLKERRDKIIEQINREFVWYQGLKDVASKGAVVLNKGKKILNKTFEMTNINKSIDVKDFDNRMLLERLLDENMSHKDVANNLNNILEQTFNFILDEWNRRINFHINALYERDKKIIDKIKENKIKFQIDSTGQIFITGITSAVVGTLGLAAGWHTLTYALVNVFPPIAIFTAIAVVFSGISNKEKAKEGLIKQVEEVFREYRRQILYLIDEERFEALNGYSIYDYFGFINDAIANYYLDSVKNLYFETDLEEINKIIIAYETHIGLIEEALG